MSMTYLQQFVRLVSECDSSGSVPTAVTGQTGERLRLVNWLATADEDIQRLHNEWRFMVGSFTFNTVASTGSYSPSDASITKFRDWRKSTLKIYLTSTGVSNEIELTFIEYQDWYDIYNVGSQTDGPPKFFTIGNDLSIKLAPKPDAVYTVTGEYQKSVTTMAANGDSPLYLAEYHMLPVYAAMVKYGLFESAPEIIQSGKTEYRRMLKEMRRTQLPRTRLGAPLA